MKSRTFLLILTAFVVMGCATTDVFVAGDFKDSTKETIVFLIDTGDIYDDDLGVNIVITQEIGARGYQIKTVDIGQYVAEKKQKIVVITYGYSATYDGFSWSFDRLTISWYDPNTSRQLAQGQHSGNSIRGYKGLTRRVLNEMFTEFEN
jgi:hypothetical protein